MKTQLLLRLVLTALFLFIVTQNKGVQLSKTNSQISSAIQFYNQKQSEKGLKSFAFLTMFRKDDDGPSIDDEEHEFLHFHFERIKNHRRYPLLKIVLVKVFLVLMHVLMVMSAIPALIQIH